MANKDTSARFTLQFICNRTVIRTDGTDWVDEVDEIVLLSAPPRPHWQYEYEDHRQLRVKATVLLSHSPH